jgi:hypothetical protein
MPRRAGSENCGSVKKFFDAGMLADLDSTNTKFGGPLRRSSAVLGGLEPNKKIDNVRA